MTAFEPLSKYFLYNKTYVNQVIDTLGQYDYSIEQQRTPIIYFQRRFPDIEENNYSAIKAQLSEFLPRHKLHFWYTQYPSEFVTVGGEKCIPEWNPQKHASAYDEIWRDTLITRIWFDNATPQNKSNDVNILMERGNFIYRYFLAINQPHRFEHDFDQPTNQPTQNK
jgi:hypothetical protein